MPTDRDLMRRAEVLSTTGAGVLGAGIGLLLERWLAAFSVALLVVGIVAHAWGMYARHRLDSRAHAARAKWEEPVYWLCWIALAGLIAYAFIAR